jgi:Ni2+-binding GTPase involved in maturation of urease and hydrogenase
MKLITIAGPPSSGKTSVIIKLIEALDINPQQIGVIKFDCLTSFDNLRYEEKGIQVKTGYSGKFCPDHFFVSNVEAAVEWGLQSEFELLITESAGLCNRCSPYLSGILSVCVIDNLAGVNTPRKIGPMLKMADVVIVTKGGYRFPSGTRGFCI